jgi:hypothetical protein
MATTDNRNAVITSIQIEGNDIVSFLNDTTYIRAMSQIVPQSPAYISYTFDSITISQVGGDSFTFSVYTIEAVGGIVFLPLSFQDTPDVIQERTIEIYRLLVTSIFKGCCECGNTEPECSIQYTAGNGTDLGTFLYDSASNSIRVNYFTANNQDFSGLWPIIQDGSWMFVFSKTDPTVYGVYQLSNYSDGGPAVYARFDATLLNGPGTFPEGTELCLDVTSVGGSLVQDWQDTLNISSLLTQNNTVDGGGFNFAWDNVSRYSIDSESYQLYNADDGGGNVGRIQIDPGAVTISGTSFIDIITPNYGAASLGWVLAYDGSGHVEYTPAGTGTVVSVGLTMPSAFTVSNSPITISGEIDVVGAGTDLEYINGLGELATLPVYTVENGLHAFGGVPGEAPPDPFLFHLGGQLIEDTLIETTDGATEYQLSVRGSADQDTRFPFGVANLGNGGVATFQDFASGSRPNPSVQIFGNTDTFRPLLNLELDGPLPNPGDPGIWENRNSFLSLRNTGTTSVGARMAIDYTFRNTSVSPSPDLYLWPAVKLIAEATSVIENDETSNFSIRMFDGGSQQDKLLLEGKGQLTLNEYGTGTFTDGTTNIDNSLTYNLAVDGSGKVWKKLATGGGSVSSVSGTGLITTSPNPIITTGTVTTSVNENRLVGRWDSAGTGIMQEITLGTNLDLTALGVLNASGGGDPYTVNNGLEPQTTPVANPNNFQLGGPLVKDTIVTGGITPFDYSMEFQDLSGFSANTNGKITLESESGNDKAEFGSNVIFASMLYTDSLNGASSTISVAGDSTTDEVKAIFSINNSFGTLGIYAGVNPSVFPYTSNMLTIRTPNVHNGTATVGQVLTLKSITGGDAGRVEFEDGGGGSNGLQDVITNDPILTANNIVTGASLDFKFDQFANFETNATNTIKAFTFSGINTASIEINTVGSPFIEMFSSQSGGSFTGITMKDTELLIKTPNVTGGAATVGQVLTLQDAATGRVEFQTAGGGTYTVNNGLEPQTTPVANPNNFQLGGPLVQNTTVTGASNTYDLTFDEMSDFTVNSKTKITLFAEDPSDPSVTSTVYSAFGSAYIEHVDSSGTGQVISQAGEVLMSYSDGVDLNVTASITGSSASMNYVDASVSFPGHQVIVDATGIKTVTPNVKASSATVGQVLTLQNATTGEVEFQDGGGTYTVNNGLSPDPSDPDIFQLGGPLIADTSISGDGNTYSLTFDDMDVLSGSADFKIAFAVNDGTTTSNFALQPNIASIGCAVNGSGNSSFAEFTDTQSRIGYLTPTQTVQFGADATGLYVLTPDVAAATATVGQVLTLINATTGESEWADGGGGGGGGGGRSYYLNGSVVQPGTFGGITDMRQMSPVPVIGVGTDFTISSNGYIKSFITDAGDPNKAVIPAGNWNFELWFSASSGGGSPNFYVELYKYDTVALTLTLISSSSTNPEGITNGTAIDLYVTALSVPQTTLALTDRLAVRVFVDNGGGGRTITLHTQGPHLSQIITDFPSGIVSLNGLTAFAQNLAVGTAGTDFDISSSVATHTFNLPTASATNRGALSNTDWTRFDSFKTQSIGITVDGSGGTITAGQKGYIRIPYACTITSWSILTGNAGFGATVTFDIWRANNAIPTVANTIVGGGTKPFLTNNTAQITSAAPTGWTFVTLAANDILGFNVESGAAVFSWVNLQLTVTRT